MRPLTLLARANVLVHVLALIGAGMGMRPGSPLVSLDERLEYLAGAPLAWTLAWAAWMLSAVSLIAFLAAVTGRLNTSIDLARLGVVIAVAGCGFDLFCDCVYLLVLPALASWQPHPEPLFLVVERTTGIASLVIANGGYSAAVLLLALALRHRKGLAPGTAGVGFAVAASGLVLAAAAFTASPAHAAWATVLTIGLFCVWVVLVARSFEPPGGPP